MSLRFPTLFAACFAAAQALPAQDGFVWEGFERETNWFADDASAASGRSVSAEFATEGGHSLKLIFKTASASGRAVYTRVESMDWSPYRALLIDLYNPSGIEGLRASLRFHTTEQGIDHEAALPPLKPGWNRDLRIDLSRPQFSSAASAYRPTGYLVGRGEIKSVSLILEPGLAAEGAVYADNLRLERGGVLNAGDFTLNTTLQGVGSGGDLGYLPPGMRLQQGDFSSVESFESGPATWTSSAPDVGISLSSEHKSQGNLSLKLAFPFIPAGFDVRLNGLETRLAKAKLFRMDVYNPGATIAVALWLEDTGGHIYTSQNQWLNHGWNTPIFDFSNQANWSGQAIAASTLAHLSSVNLTVYPAYGGALYFDGLSTSSISIRGAAQVSVLGSLSYHPSSDLEARLDLRVEDTLYAPTDSGVRDAGAEAFIDAGDLRYDLGGFRQRLLYRHRVTAFDQPIMPLIFADNLGLEIAALESSGRIGSFEVQGLAAGRLEYQRSNSRQPTGLGPDQVQGLRARTKVGEDSRIGFSLLNHQASWGGGVTGLPLSRQTYGMDLDSHWKRGDLSLNWALEGALTAGDGHAKPGNDFLVQLDDHFYAGIKLTPEWGRLKLNYIYNLVGYDFDADFTQYGGNEEWHYGEAGLNLEHWGWFRALQDLPLYDHTLGNNLRATASVFSLVTRSQYRDLTTGLIVPVTAWREYRLRLENDYKARPHFSLEASFNQADEQWTYSGDSGLTLNLRLPAWFNTTLTANGGHRENRFLAKTITEQGLGGTDFAKIGVEWHSESNLFVNVQGNWTGIGKSWQGIWSPGEGHFKWTAGIQQNFGSDTVLRLDYGLPALLGYDFGLQDTLHVYTVTLKTYL